MIPLYSSIERFSTPGRRLIALTMLKTLPARPIAASYSSASRPVASSTSISRRCATASILAHGPGGVNPAGPGCGG